MVSTTIVVPGFRWAFCLYLAGDVHSTDVQQPIGGSDDSGGPIYPSNRIAFAGGDGVCDGSSGDLGPFTDFVIFGGSSSAPIRFSLDLPLVPGATRVTGHGPAGLKIAIVDVSLGTDEIGTGKIGADGAFAVDVKPLPAGDRIGIMAGAPLPSEFEANLDLLWGDGGIQLPMFGNVFASVVVGRQ